jgi:glycerol-3-phosphate cytidylyltransferase
MKVGYTTGVYDLFHIGHLNILKNAKSMCDKLIVGVSTDQLVKKKLKKSVIPYSERVEIVRSCKYVDTAVPQTSTDKILEWERLKFDILFVGDDWHKSNKWNIYEKKLSLKKVKIIYFPYTKGTSSTLINTTLNALRKKNQ